MVETHPKKITGPWAKGFALDDHTLSSDYLGDDEFGNATFDTRRSELGELLYLLKFKGDKSVLKTIVDTASDFIGSVDFSADVIVPVPPSNLNRPIRPPVVIAEGIGERLGIPVLVDGVVKVKRTPELKNLWDRGKRLALLRRRVSGERNRACGQDRLADRRSLPVRGHSRRRDKRPLRMRQGQGGLRRHNNEDEA